MVALSESPYLEVCLAIEAFRKMVSPTFMNLLPTCTMMSVSVQVPVSLFHRKKLQISQIQQKNSLV